MRLAPKIAAAALLLAPACLAATARHPAPPARKLCQTASERAAFDVIGLRSQLTVTALACHNNADYEAFVTRFRPDLVEAEKTLNVYFKRAYGNAGTKKHDEYITDLAGIQEQDGLKAGSVVCDNLPLMFGEVASLHDSSELNEYVNAKLIAQPMSFELCPAPAAPVKKVKKTVSKAKHA